MKTFNDSTGKEWTISITVDAIKRVNSLLEINLADITEGDPPLLTRLETDIVLLCDVIFVLIKPQADEANISDEEFGRALGGDAIANAHDAFWSELADFFRSMRRSDQARAIEKQTQLTAAAVQAADRKIEMLSVDDLVERALGDSPGNWPASSGSIPDR